MYRLKALIRLTVVASFMAITGASITQAATVHHAAGTCGEYSYWHNGHCVDARTKPGKDWTANVYF